jgi:predicted component of viral defense system (DUF524 family)
MEPSALEALRFQISDEVSLRLEDPNRLFDRPFNVILAESCRGVLSTRRMDAPQPSERPPFLYDAAAPDRGLNALRIFELRDYSWELEIESGPVAINVTSSLYPDDKDLRAGKNHGRLAFVNFLGAAWIKVAVAGQPPVTISFEVASPKLDYEQEYRSMVEAIGEECQQLLLEWGTPTTLNISADPEKQAQILLEKFLFLRHVLGPDRLDLYLEIIQRRPHSRLQSERDWKPAGAANPALFLRDPLRHGRGWHRTGAQPVPDEIREERKFDSLDTPPNRFLKFALQNFRGLCDEFIKYRPKTDGSITADPVVLEARAMQNSLDAFLALPLFDDVGDLKRIPFESTALQRREGYREILHAWLMLDAAAQLDWPGHADAYDGTSRDVATLYEYWLFFILVRAFRERLDMIPGPKEDPLEQVDGAMPACCRADDGRLTVNLRKGKTSFCRFRWKPDDRKLAVHFFYNRSFGRRSVGESGSYSKTFWPDFSLVIIPEEFISNDLATAERAAEAAGRIAYLHFDAKYRGENLAAVLGAEHAGPEEDEPAASTAKNEDLYKMHTYNEAIRRTVGSYILYPGTASAPQDANKKYQRYHEIIPGIGAFALRPGAIPPAGLEAVVNFIRDILEHHLTAFSQSYRIDYWTESTIREDRVEYTTGPSGLRLGDRPPKDTRLCLGYVRGEDAAFDCRNTRTFFCHAVEWKPGGTDEPGEATNLQFDPLRSDFLVVYHRGRTAGWAAKVGEVKLVTAKERAEETGRPLADMHAAYYYRFPLEEIQEIAPRDVTSLVARRPREPRDCTVSAFALCPLAAVPNDA